LSFPAVGREVVHHEKPHLAGPPDLKTSNNEVLTRAADLLVGRKTYETAIKLYPKDASQYRIATRIIVRSDRT
jgi:hypothetical protein